MTAKLIKVPAIYTEDYTIIQGSSFCNGSTKTEILSQRATKAKTRAPHAGANSRL